MALLDFREIPQAGTSSGQQDAFELFAREVLEMLGFRVVQGPSRGADLGKDLIVEETRVGLVGDTKLRWLVSCKHFVFSGGSVRPDDEKNVLERVSAAGCNGFLGFYSTLPSSGLSELLHRQSSISIKLLDHEEIERHLLASVKGQDLIQRYFPVSAQKLERPPAKIFDDPVSIECENCGKDLLRPLSGVWVMWRDGTRDIGSEGYRERIVDMYFSCKGQCDRIMASRVKTRHAPLRAVYDGWDDIPDLAVPTVFITKIMAVLNGLSRGDQYEPEAFDKLKNLLIATFPLVSRHLNEKDQQKLASLRRIPSYLGGMGYDL